MTDIIKTYSDELDTGLYPTANARFKPMWDDGRGVSFEDMCVKAALGDYGLFYTSTAEKITGIRSTLQNNVRVIYYGTPTKLFRWAEGNDPEDLSGTTYSGTDRTLWSFSRWGEWMVATNGTDDGLQVDRQDSNGFVTLSTPFDFAKIIYGTDTHLLAFNTSDGGEIVAWTDTDDITAWTQATDNQAGEYPLRNLDSEIKAVKPLGGTIGIYTTNELYGANYIRAPYVFGFRGLLEGIGAVGKRAIAVVGSRHFGMGPRGLWVSDGSSYDYIDSPAMKTLIYEDSEFRFDQTKGDLVCVWHDQLQSLVRFSYPTVGSEYNNITVNYNYKNKTYTIDSFGRTYADDSGVFEYTLSGDRQGNIFLQSPSALPPSDSEAGFVDLTNAEGTIASGYGELGYGELGYGGVRNDAG